MDEVVLIVDDDRTERRLTANSLRNGIALTFLEAEDGKDALRILNKDNEKKIKLVILDLEMPVVNGLETLKVIHKDFSQIPVIVLTGSTRTEDAVLAMQSGAVDFLSKPIEPTRLNVSAQNALKMSLMSQEISRLKRHTEYSLKFTDLIGYDQDLKESIRIAQKAAACDLPILITGETGTGKEMVANSIHGESRRFGKSFIAVNCGAIPEKLIESTLFGHEKGAFTGAIARAKGKFQEAQGGTIFLDEVGELPLDAQVKLLRVLQQKEIEAVGSARSIPVDVRIISATNRNLADDVRKGRFREDLYFRLNVLHIDLPPLRKRTNDIIPLIDHFIQKFCATNQSLPKQISVQAMMRLKNHFWPGNIRELENIINRAMALSDNKNIESEDIAFVNSTWSELIAPPSSKNMILLLHPDGSFKKFRELEQNIIAAAIQHHNQNMTQTARALGLAKSTLYAKIEDMAENKKSG